MKTTSRIVALLLLVAVLIAAPWAAQTAVIDVKDKLKPPAPEWAGILSVAVVPSFPTVNVMGWLGAQSRVFEKQQGNVLISAREMTREGVRAGAAAENLPDVLLFGTGVFDDPEQLLVKMAGEVALKEGLADVGYKNGVRYTVPLALGGYALLGNQQQLDQIGWSPSLTFDETMGLIQQNQLSIASPAMPYTNPLAALAGMGDTKGVVIKGDLPHGKIWADYAIEKKHVFYMSTQREVRRMATLSAGGKGFDTVLIAPGAPVYVDQVLMGGMVDARFSVKSDDAQQRIACAGKFFSFLLTQDAQLGLSQAGLFPVTDATGAYEAGSQMAQIERSLQGEIACVDAFG